MTLTQKITACIMIIGAAGFVIYDILILNVADDSTLSAVMYIMLKFPLIIYAWFVLGGHFISPFKIKKQYIKILIAFSIVILVLSILSITNIIHFNSFALCIIALVGFIVGITTWSQKIAIKD